MSNITSRFMQAIKVLGIMAVVTAFAVAAFPTSSFAAPTPNGGGDYGKVSITIYNASRPSTSTVLLPVTGAAVEVMDSAGVMVMKSVSDTKGVVNLALAEGSYKIAVSANGFKPAGGYVQVKNGQLTSVSIGMTSLIRPNGN